MRVKKKTTETLRKVNPVQVKDFGEDWVELMTC